MRKIAFSFLMVIFCFTINLHAQKKKPKLIVGIVVDQMRLDYIYRFENKFTDNGFKELIKNGFFGKNTHYNYVPTYTGPGHASIFSGTTPSVHGIIGNDWFVKSLRKEINCVSDSLVSVVGAEGEESSSPVNLLSSNFADELKIGSQGRSKVVGVSIKNRGAILPAGHFPDGAYWFDPNSGNFITSTYYKQKLPEWVKTFNEKQVAKKYMTGKWETLLPITTYTESGPDASPYEANLGMGHTFPYDLTAIRKKDKSYKALSTTPFGNSIIADMALAALSGESLGADSETDLLTISFSSTDYIGHRFGPDSKEIEDCYLRLDLEIAELIDELNKKVGKDEYVIFLTADHAVAHVPQFLIDKRIPAGYIERTPVASILLKTLSEKYGEGEWIFSASNDQLFLNKELIADKEIDLNEFTDEIIKSLLSFKGIKKVFRGEDLNRYEYTNGIAAKLQNGYNTKRSGDLLLVYEPGWFVKSYGKTGTTHGSGYNYDTHVPLLIYGQGIPKGYTSYEKISITDIVPSLCLKYEVNLPNGTTGNAIKELFKK